LKLPQFVADETSSILKALNPVVVNVSQLLSLQQDYHKKAVKIDGSVGSSVNVDEPDEATVATWFFEMIPKTITTTSSSTYFYLEDGQGNRILVKYPADLDVSLGDEVTVTGYFNAHAVTVDAKNLWATKKEKVVSVFGEPFISAVIVENSSKQKVEYVRRPWSA
jgi:hypothetical protein